jgi:hypothetical protein
MSLFYLNNINHELVEYVDAWYLSNQAKCSFQSSYLFTCGNNSISRRSRKKYWFPLHLTTLYKDNITRMTQLKGGYIKGDRKNISH